jgi:hypothetical protein
MCSPCRALQPTFRYDLVCSELCCAELYCVDLLCGVLLCGVLCCALHPSCPLLLLRSFCIIVFDHSLT